MDNDTNALEQVLRARAAEIPSAQEAPHAMVVRARRRVVRNVLSSALVVAVVVGGASAGFANLGALGSRHVPGHGPSPSPSVATSPAPCSAGDLRATASLEGAAGSVIGPLHVTNFSSRTCTLTGKPGILLTRNGGALTVQEQSSPPQWRVDAASAPAGWPVVTLRPGAAADIRVQWTNACPQSSRPVLWKIVVGGGPIDVFGSDAAGPPPCNGSGLPSTLFVGPFEPGAGK